MSDRQFLSPPRIHNLFKDRTKRQHWTLAAKAIYAFLSKPNGAEETEQDSPEQL